MPPSLDSRPSLPPNLHRQNPVPTVDDIKAQIEPWVVYNLQKTILSNYHYENQLYGAWNTFLGSVYPINRRFMIIPQALVRRAITDPDQIDEDLGNISFGSTGAIHESRDMEGAEDEKKFPDFMPVKVRLHRGEPTRDYRVLCVIELKREGASIARGDNQMTGYMQQLAAHPSREENLIGFLIIGRKVRKYELLENNGEWRVVSSLLDSDLFYPRDGGDPFTTTLCTIASANWN